MYYEHYIIDNSLSDKLDFREDDLLEEPVLVRENKKEWNRVEQGIYLKYNTYYIKTRINGKWLCESTKSNSIDKARELLQSYLDNRSLLQTQRADMSLNSPICL
jgi:hypothetical protein